MKKRTYFIGLPGWSVAALSLAALLGEISLTANESTPPAAESASYRRLAQLIDSAPYSSADKEALKAGLGVAALDAGSTGVPQPVAQSTIDIQVKNTTRDLPASITFLFDVSKCLKDNRAEFLAGPQYQRVPEQDRVMVAGYLDSIVEEYTALTLEGLFAQFGRNIQIPSDVPRSVTNATYRQLLALSARTIQQPKTAAGSRFAAQAPAHHTIKTGDSLAYLGRIYGVAPAAIVAANPGLVAGRVRVGQIVYIPGPVTPAAVATPAAPATPVAPAAPATATDVPSEPAGEKTAALVRPETTN